MSPNLVLESLSLTELKILLGHLKLGKNHLTVLLDEVNLKNLLQLGNISFHAKNNVSTNKAEKLGNIALILNTIITSCFGAWMGLYGFLGLKLDSYNMLIAITLVAAVIALGMSAVSIKLTNTEAQEAMYNQKIHHLQGVVLKNILSKLNEEFKSAVNYLNHSLSYLNEETDSETRVYSFKNIEHFYQWYEIFTNLIAIKQKNEQISSFFTQRLTIVVKEMKDLLNCHFSHPALSQPLANKKLKIIHAPQTGYNSLLKVPREHFVFSNPRQSWLKRNYFPLLAGLPPVMLGGFASMFVFLTGGPNLAKELGLIEIMNLLKHPVSEFIEFTIALCLTFYYGWAFFYSNYRNHMRQMELAKTKRKLGFLEKKEVFLERRVALLLKLKQKTQQIIDIFSANNALSPQNK